MTRLHLRIVIALVTLMAGVGSVSAADVVVPPALSLSEAVKLALSVNTGLKSAGAQHQTALSRLRIASYNTTYSVGTNLSAEKNPSDSGLSSTVFADATYENLMGTQATLEVSPFGLGNERGSVGLSVRHPLMKRKGVLSAKSDEVLSASSDAIIQNKELFRSEQSTVLSVVRAYCQAVEAREQVKIQEKALQLVEQSAKDAAAREKEGYARGIEVSRAEVQVAQTRERLNLQRESAKATINRLMLAIGVGVGQTPELTDGVPEAKVEIPTLDEAIKKALENRVEVAMWDERLATQKRRLEIANEELKPGLDAVARFRSTNDDTGFLSTSLFDLGSTTVGLELRLPIDRRIIMEERSIADREMSLMKEERTFQMEQIEDDVRSAYRSLESAETSLDIYTQNLEVANENLRIAGRMVEEGEGDNRDVLSAQEALANVESGIISAKTDLYLAAMELKFAMGEDLTTMGSK